MISNLNYNFHRRRQPPMPSGALPLYYRSAALNTWVNAGASSALSLVQPADPAGLSASGWLSWSGATLAGTELLVFGGGHGDSSSNAVLAVDLALDTPVSVLRRTASTSGVPVNGGTITGVPHYGDGKPTSRHSSYDIQYIAARNRMFVFGGWAIYSNPATSINNVDAFNLATNDWDLANTYTAQANLQSQNAPNAVCQDTAGNVYIWTCSDATNWPLYKWTQSTATWSTLHTNSPRVYDAPMAYDPIRNRLVLIDGASSMYYDLTSNTKTNFSTTASRSSSFFWCDDISAFMHRPFGGSIQVVDPVTFTVSSYSVSGTPPSEGSGGEASPYGRFGYCQPLGIVYYIASRTANLHVFRTR